MTTDDAQVCLPPIFKGAKGVKETTSPLDAKEALKSYKTDLKFYWQRYVPEMSIQLSENYILENNFSL